MNRSHALAITLALALYAPAALAEIDDGRDEYTMLREEAQADRTKPSASGPEASRDYLAKELSENMDTMDPQTVIYNLDAISELTAGKAAQTAYIKALARPESAVKLAALKQLSRYHDAETESHVIKQLESPDYAVRTAAVAALVKINGTKTRLAVESAAENDDDSRVRGAAKTALKELSRSEKPAPSASASGAAETAVKPVKKFSVPPGTVFSNKKGKGK